MQDEGALEMTDASSFRVTALDTVPGFGCNSILRSLAVTLPFSFSAVPPFLARSECKVLQR